MKLWSVSYATPLMYHNSVKLFFTKEQADRCADGLRDHVIDLKVHEVEDIWEYTGRYFKQKILSILEARYNITTNIVNVEGFEEEVEAAAKDAGVENFYQNFWCVTEAENYTTYSYTAMWKFRDEPGFFNDIIEVYEVN